MFRRKINQTVFLIQLFKSSQKITLAVIVKMQYIGKKTKQITRQRNGTCHSGASPVPQLAVNTTKSNTMSLFFLLLLLVSALPPPSLSHFLPTHFLSFLTKYCSLPPLSKSRPLSSFLSHTVSSLTSAHSQKKRERELGMSQSKKTYQNTKQHSLCLN